jgi:Protein of unknown function (DUF2971)
MTDQELIQQFNPLFVDLDGFHYLLEKKPLLAHYTSIQVLEKIMKSEEMWFSNPLFMNDLEEMRFGIHQGKIQFDQLRAEITRAAASQERFKVIESAFMGYYREFDSLHALDIYVFCLSEHHQSDNDGLLSMWRAYGASGNGAALVFNTSFLTGPKDDSPLLIGKVHYASGEQRKAWLEDKIRAWYGIIEGKKIPDDKLHLAAHALFTVIKIYALTSKHRGFGEENEWRLIYLPDRDPNGLLKGCFDYVIGKQGVEPKLKFKIAPLALKSPEVWTFEGILDRIILGPSLSTMLARSSIIRMLEVIGKPTFGSKVVSSGIPLRPS